MSKKPEEYIIRTTEMNNKSRRGEYIYIKQRGKQGRYYKNVGGKIDAYLEYYKDSTNKRRKPKGRIKDYIREYEEERERKTKKPKLRRQANKYLKRLNKKVRRAKPIESEFKKGIKSTTIKDLKQVDSVRLRTKLKELFRTVVLDEKLLDILTQPSNLEKIKHRLEYKISMIGDKEETIAETVAYNKNPYNAISELKEISPDGQTIEKGTYKLETDLDKAGYVKMAKHKEGKIKRTEVRITFIKQR